MDDARGWSAWDHYNCRAPRLDFGDLGVAAESYANAPEGYFTKPFRFEDLEGGQEPKQWGPFYPNLGASVEKWRKLDKKRELTKDEGRQWGAAVGEAIRKLNRPPKSGPIPLHCTVQNTCGTDNTAAGEEERYQRYVDRLNAERLARRQSSDPLWLDRKIVAALEREFADIFMRVEREEFAAKAQEIAARARPTRKRRAMRNAA